MSCGLGNSSARVCVIRVNAGPWAQTRRGRAPSGAICPQCVQHQRILPLQNGSRPPLSWSMRCIGKGTGGLVDHCDVVDGLKNPHRQFGLISTPLVRGPLHIMIGILDHVANAEKMLKNLASEKPPLRTPRRPLQSSKRNADRVEHPTRPSPRSWCRGAMSAPRFRSWLP